MNKNLFYYPLNIKSYPKGLLCMMPDFPEITFFGSNITEIRTKATVLLKRTLIDRLSKAIPVPAANYKGQYLISCALADILPELMLC